MRCVLPHTQRCHEPKACTSPATALYFSQNKQPQRRPLPTRHCQALPRRNGLVIVFRGRKMHQGQTSGNFCLSVPYDIPIISQKNAHNHSKEAPSMNFTSTNKNFAPTWCVWSDVRRGGRPRRLWLSLSGFMCLLGVGKNELRFLAMPAASELVFIGPVGSSLVH